MFLVDSVLVVMGQVRLGGLLFILWNPPHPRTRRRHQGDYLQTRRLPHIHKGKRPEAIKGGCQFGLG